MTRQPHWFAVAILLGVMHAPSAQAQLFASTWDDDSGTHLWRNSSSPNYANWFPALPPLGAVSLGEYSYTQNHVVMLNLDYGLSFSQVINYLEISRGVDLINSADGGATSSLLHVEGDISISARHGSGSSITVYGNGLEGRSIFIEAGGTLNLNSQAAAGTAVVKAQSGYVSIDPGATLSGNGRIELTNPDPSFNELDNLGTLTAGAFGLNPPATELRITGAGAIVDLDGPGGSGVVNVNKDATLRIDAPTVRPFSGDLNLFTGSTLRMSNPWVIDGGTIDINTPGIGFPPPPPGPAAHLAGGDIIYSGGTMTLGNIDSLSLDAPFTATGGVINNSGTITVNAAVKLQTGADVNMLGNDAKLVVNSALNITVPDFDLDANGAVGNVTTINASGNLDLRLGAGADEDFNHVINLNGGTLDVRTLDDAWSLDSGGVINANGPSISTVNGETLHVNGGAAINVAASTQLNVNAPVQFNGTASVNIGAGAVLNLGTALYNHPLAMFAGAGTLYPGNATIELPTAWNVAKVNLDDGNVTLNASLFINADTIDDQGDGFDGSLVLSDGARLTVNIAGGGGWAVDSGGAITYNGDNADSNAYLAGSSITLNGTLNHTGRGLSEARLDIGPTGHINIAADSFFAPSGGNDTTSPNTIAGGTIDGAGHLFFQVGHELRGFGTIAAFAQGIGELRASGGVLNITGGQLVETVGTEDDSGILNVTTPWNTIQSATVELKGGELRGATITNGGNGIKGHGLVSARIVNNWRIDAENSGTLLLNTSGHNNDWDGADGIGQLNAVTANLELVDSESFPFTGTVRAESGTTVFANGFELEFEPGSTLKLTAGKFRSTAQTHFGGNATVYAGGASTLQMDQTAIFESGSVTTLSDDLLLEDSSSFGITVQPDAQFHATAPGAALVINTGVLRLLDGVESADLDVPIENRSALDLGPVFFAAQATAGAYQQTATGSLFIDLRGTGPDDFDRLGLTGTASLAGKLYLAITGGYVPVLGQTFDVLSANGGVSGTFGTVTGSGMPAGLKLDVIYKPTGVSLKVVANSPFSADFDRDLDVDGADLTVWKGAFGVNALGNADGDNDSDGADFLAWQRQRGSPSNISPGAEVPEPSAAIMATVMLAALTGHGAIRQRRPFVQRLTG